MGKKKILSFVLAIITLFCCLSFNIFSGYAQEEKVYLGGLPAGFSMATRGVKVVGLCDVITKNGAISPSKDADIRIGDIILTIENLEINSASDIETAISGQQSVDIQIRRKGETLNKILNPAKDLSGNEKLGIFIKDDICGIGTITYIKGNRFASLGHPVIDESGEIIEIISGNLYNCNITGCVKGERGKAGELRGIFLKNNPIAHVDKNTQYGVYGKITDDIKLDSLQEISLGQAVVGDAEIYTTLNGNSPKNYSISIVKIDNNNGTKNFVIKINDKNLLNQTNGIVQGMSGSPIVQNGKLVGAVTHVFINDPTRGFGLSIHNMINN